MPMAQRLAATFTSTSDLNNPRTCGAGHRCKIKVFPPGTQFFHVEHAGGAREGRWVCSECFEYYRGKASSKILGTPRGREYH